MCLRHDRGLPLDPLGAGLLEAFGAEEVSVLSQRMTRDPGAEAWGRRAPVVFRAAEAGSALAGRVIEDGGRALAGLVGTLLARGAAADGVVAAGGVVTQQPRFLSALDGAVRERHPGLRVTLLETAPVAGAVWLARALVASGDAVV